MYRLTLHDAALYTLCACTAVLQVLLLDKVSHACMVVALLCSSFCCFLRSRSALVRSSICVTRVLLLRSAVSMSNTDIVCRTTAL